MFGGARAGSDHRFGDKTARDLGNVKLEDECFKTKLDVDKIKIDYVSEWVEEKIEKILGFEDEIMAGMIVNEITEKSKVEGVDPKRIFLAVSAFLDQEKATAFTVSH